MGPKLVEEIENCVKFVPHMEQVVPDRTVEIAYPLGFDSPICRYMSIKRYLEMIETGVNALSHFSLWEDPYEAYLIRAAISDCARNGNARGEQELYGKYKLVYGQSWTLNGGESDVLWRAFGNRGDVVRVRSTIRKLFNTFVGDSLDSKPIESLKLRIGDVEYCNQADLKRDIECQKLAEDLDGEMRFFFRKRKEFADEHELRCVAVVKDEEGLDKRTDVNGSVLKFRIGNIDDFVEEVLLDPRVSPCVREQVVCRTLHRSSKIKVEQSDLFEWPDIGKKNVALVQQPKGGYAPSVRERLIPVLRSNRVTDEELDRLCELDYSRRVFGLAYPLLITDVETASTAHYWEEVYDFHGRRYRVCNDWKADRNEDKFETWLGEHA